jgi:hypothetical protein
MLKTLHLQALEGSNLQDAGDFYRKTRTDWAHSRTDFTQSVPESVSWKSMDIAVSGTE